MSGQVTVINRQGIASIRPSDAYWNALGTIVKRTGKDIVAMSNAAPGFRHIAYVYLDGQVHQTVISN